ncbi:SDR family oxidoreductase [Chitinophaga lutea]
MEQNDQPMRDKAVLITGGTTGIGRATALLLAMQGAKVLVLGRHQEALQDTLQDAAKKGLDNNLFAIEADMGGKEGVAWAFEQADALLGGLDVLINNAALGYGSILEGQYDDWKYTVDVNLLGYLACTREAIDRMKARGGGHIVHVGSMSAETREKDSSVYVATKSGIKGFSESLRKEVNPLGIRVTLIEPGAVGTDMQPYSSAEQREKIEKQEMLRAEDIADSILYVLTRPPHCDVVEMQIRPHLQLI